MKQLILQIVPESWHMFYHRNICLRFGVSGELSILAVVVISLMVAGFFLLFLFLRRQLNGQ